MSPLNDYSLLSKFKTKNGQKWLSFILIERIIRGIPYPNFRSWILKRFGAKIGNLSFIHDVVFQNVYGMGFKNLILGDKTTIQTQCVLDLADKIIMEDCVTISPGVMILTHEDCGQKLGKPLSKYYPPKKAPVIIGHGSWVGARAVILCGVKIGAQSIVAAGSVVNKDVDDNTLVGGIPAKFIKRIPHE